MIPKVAKAIFLLLFVTTGLSAAEVTWVNAFPFYVYGDVSFIAPVYEFVSAVVVDSTVQIILGLGFTIAALMTGYQSRLGGGVEVLKSMSAPIALYIFFVVPSVNVHITDLRVDKGLITYNVPDGGYKKVEDVPFAIAAIPTSASLLVSVFIDLIDDNWGSISVGSQFSSLGYQGISRLSKEAMMISQLEDIDDANISATAYNLNQYIKHCLIRKGFEVDNKNRHTLTHPSVPFPDMWDPANYAGGLASATVSFDGNKDADGQPVDGVTCATLYAAYVSGVDSDVEAGMKELLAQRFPGIDPDSTDLNDAWSDQTGVDLNLVGNISKAMTTTAMTRALEQSFQVEGIGVSGVAYATEISMQTTMANLRTEGLAKYEWIARTLPDAITIVLGILIGAFPLMILVMSFMGKNAIGGVANFFMGYIAINFNLVSLALVNNIISYYTAQHAQDAIVSYAGMPFGLTQVGDFMMQQADMAGFAGIIGAASIFAVTPLIFKGETAGFGAAMSALSGAYRGNVMASASKELTDYDAQQALDRKVTTADGMTEAEAGAWLSKEGFTRPANMSAVESYNAMMKNYGAIGAADAASIMHSGNAGKFNTDNYISGSAGQSMQSMGKTAGLGANMNSGGVNSASMADIGSVSIQDGEIMGSTLHNTRENRDTASNSEAGFDTGTIGAGMAAQQVAKEMASQEIGKDAGAFEKLTASARQGALEQLATGAASADKMFGNNGFGALSGTGNAHLKNVMTQAAEKISSSAGRGSTVDYDAANAKAHEDGARDGSAVNRASKHMFSGEKDKDGRLLYDRDLAAEGQAMSEMAGLQQSMQTAKAATNEQNGYADYITGKGASARKDANDAIGVGEGFGAMKDSEQIDLMKQAKENAARGFEGGIKAANAELHANGRSVDDAIADDITGAIEKGVGSSTHADNLRTSYGNSLKGMNAMDMSPDDRAKLFDSALAEKDPAKKAAMLDMLDEANRTGGVSKSLADVMGTIDQSKIDSQLGQAIGIEQNRNAGVNYAQNAMYGEMSSQQSTMAKLDAQGGVHGAIKVDTTEASLKAKTQEDVLDAQLKQGGAKDGLDSGLKSLAQATDKLAQTAGTLAGGKTAGDIAGTGKYDSPAQYAEAQAKAASAEASKAKAKMLLDKDQEANEKMTTNMLYRAGEGYVGDEKKEKVVQAAKQMEKAGLLERNEKGDLVASVGTKFSDGMAVLNSGDMGRDSQVQIAGTSMNIDRDMDGNTRIAATSKESVDRGEGLDYSVSGYMGAVGVGALMGVGAVGAANQYSKHMAAEKVPMKMSDMQGAKPDGNGGFVDSKGNGFGLNNKGEVVRDGKVAMKDNPNYKKGYIKSAWDKQWDKQWEKVKKASAGDNAKANKNTVNETTDSGDNKTPNNNTNEGSQSNKNNVTQGTPPNDVNSKDSIAKNGESSKVTGVNSKGKEYEFNPDHKTSRNAYLASNEGAHSVMHENALAHAKAQMNKPDLSAPKKSFFGRLGDAASGGGGFRGKLAAMAAVMGLGAVASEAGTLSSAGHGATTSGGGFLQGASETLGNAEFAGGLGTMAAGAMAKYSSVAAGAAKFGARVMPGVGIAYGAADTAYRARNGDNVGAAMSAGIAAVSTVPVFGTAAAVGLGAVQIATDAMGITGGVGEEY